LGGFFPEEVTMKKINPVLTGLLGIAIWIFLCSRLYNFVQTASSTEIIRWIIFFVIFIIFIVLMAIFPALNRFVDSALTAYLRFVFWYFLFFIPFLPFYFLYKIVLQYLPGWLEVLILILWGACLVAAIWALVLEKNRIRIFAWLRERVDTHAPLAYSFNLLWIGIFFFSSLTHVLVQSGILLWVVPIGQNITPEKIADFYFWHFLDAVPVFKITDTLLWKEPLTYDSGWIGLLLLLFKITVISPIIGAFVWYWRFIGQENKESNTKIRVRKRVPRTYLRKLGPHDKI
jgi:hypothetical protein